MDPYQSLANTIVLQATKDYRDALKKLKRNPSYAPALSTKNECERFFRSAWYEILTSVDGELLMEKLQAEVS